MADTKAEEAPVGRCPSLHAASNEHMAPQDGNMLIKCLDYSLANPDTLTKYKTAATISQKVLETVSG